MFSSVLVANRGEIAVRIFRTAKTLGMRTIAVYSEADRNALHVAHADEAYAIGPPPAARSYLDIERILEAARASGAACVHPGYGFLAENADFAEAVARAGAIFVGPPAEALRIMGLKDVAKERMRAAGVPIVPGYAGEAQDARSLADAAEAVGYPVMVKAVAGGGGKGMRRVGEPAALEAALGGARREAEAAFGDGRLMIEKCLERPRHVEVQVFADTHGGAVHLFERDCSLQRRQQKIVEEAPAPGMTAGLRHSMTEAAVAAARAVGYVGAGTVEFLTDGGRLADDTPFYFLEMNTRLQVEHPVTEAVTGTDLVAWQFRVAAGEPLPASQEAIRLQGHAVEARVYAEDADRGFTPSSGPLLRLAWPDIEGVRIDTGVTEGDAVTPHYDPMIAKLIAHAGNREDAIVRLRAALAASVIAGPRTNLHLVHTLLERSEVRDGIPDTGLVERALPELLPAASDPVAIARGAEFLLRRATGRIEARRAAVSNDSLSPWSRADGFVLGARAPERRQILCNGVPCTISVEWTAEGPRVTAAASPAEAAGSPAQTHVVAHGDAVLAVRNMRQWELRLPDPARSDAEAGTSGGEIRAPMHGKITQVFAREGQNVRRGERVAVLEAMKMEHVLQAPRDGVVERIPVGDGMQVEEGALVALIGEAADP